jgi:dihydrofolate synthase/folylpolyglutamate synthase
LFPKAHYYFLNQIFLVDSKLSTAAKSFNIRPKAVYNSVSEAYNQTTKSASKSDFIYVGSSTFVVAEFYNFCFLLANLEK